MIECNSRDEIEKLIEEYNNERKFIRRVINDISFASQGSYPIRDLWEMPLSYVQELKQYIGEINEKRSEAMKQSSGKITKTF